MLKAGFISLGCSKNLVDTEVMLGILAKNNIEITAEPAKADILIVNTCTFIQSAKEESITYLSKPIKPLSVPCPIIIIKS